MTENETMVYRLEQAEKHLAELDAELEQLREEAKAREHERLKWGVGALGSVVLMLGAVIWQYRSAIFK